MINPIFKQNPIKVLVIDDVHPDLFEYLKAPTFEVVYLPEINPNDIVEFANEVEILVLRSKLNLDEEYLSLFKNLKLIARVGAGMDNIDEKAAGALGIHLINAPEGNEDAVAEHTLGLLLALFNKLAWSDKEIRAGRWPRKEARGLELKGKTIGIIGFGHMGKAFSQRLQGFDVRILAYDKYKSGFGNHQVIEVDLDTFYKECQVVSLHVPLSEETKGMVDLEFIYSFSHPFYLINTARGQIIDQESVRYSIMNRKLLGMALDVLPNERINQLLPAEKDWFEWLISRDEVVLSPHVAGWSAESYQKLSKVIGQKILQFVLFQ